MIFVTIKFEKRLFDSRRKFIKIFDDKIKQNKKFQTSNLLRFTMFSRMLLKTSAIKTFQKEVTYVCWFSKNLSKIQWDTQSSNKDFFYKMQILIVEHLQTILYIQQKLLFSVGSPQNIPYFYNLKFSIALLSMYPAQKW